MADYKDINIPMNHAITTCRHKVDRKKYDDGWERIWGKKKKRQEEWRKELTKHNRLVPDD